MIWKGLIGINVAVATIFVVLIIVLLVGFGVSGLGEFAIVTSFWLLPLLVILDLAVLAVFILLKQPKGKELTRPLIWVVSTGAAAFLLITVYVGLASVS